jgi:c-di-GMP phosphodiesterase
MRIAKVKTHLSENEILVPITSQEKPQISEENIKKWQKILDLAANIIGVPSGLINRLNEDSLEIFITSKTPGNIFEQNVKLDLGLGWYCEHVTGSRNEFILPNALKDESWKNNPSVPFNIISYLGIPIFWPDGEVFGTFCMLDNKEIDYNQNYLDLLNSFREIIQNDLNNLLLLQQIKDDLVKKEIQLREINHRVKNHFNLLISTLSLQSSKSKDEKDVRSIIDDIRFRINTISMIHDKLSISRNLDNIMIGDYLKELGNYLIINLSQINIIFECNSPKIIVPVDLSVTCGIIMNELITNSIKYAFKGIQNPSIIINIDRTDNNITFEYKDNGKGLPDEVSIDGSASLGMTLIRISVQQLNGSYQINNDNGFNFKMTFRIPAK